MKRIVSTLMLSLTIADVALAQDSQIEADQICDNPLVGMVGITKSVCRVISAQNSSRALEGELAGLILGEASQTYDEAIAATEKPVQRQDVADQPQACLENPLSMSCEIALIDQRIENEAAGLFSEGPTQ